MTTKSCTECGTEFEVWGKQKTCSTECGKANFNKTRREWRRQPRVKSTEREYSREYHSRPEVKEADRKRDQKRREKPEREQYERMRKAAPAHKEYMRAYQHTPQRKAYSHKYRREYALRPEAKEAACARRRREDVKEQKRLYDQGPAGKAAKRARNQTPEYKEKARAYNAQPGPTEKRRQTTRKWRVLSKIEAMKFARDLLAGKYPDLIPANHEPCLLYTATCRETGRTLYIGITDNWQQRQKQHAVTHKGALWLPTAEITVDVYPSRTLAMAAEMLAIKERKPIFNVTHNTPSGINVDN